MLDLIHGPTLVVVTFAMMVIFTVLIVWQSRVMPDESTAIVWFAGGSSTFALGGLLVALRGHIPLLLSLPVGNGLLCLGLGLAWLGLSHFDKRRASLRLVLVLTALTVVGALPLTGYRLTVIVSSFSLAMAALLAASVPLRTGQRTSPRVMVAIGFVAFAVATGARGLSALFFAPVGLPLQMADMNDHGIKALLLLTCAAASFWTAGFLLLVSERMRDKLSFLASHDAMTMVYNRRAFLEIAERELLRSTRSEGPVTLVLADLDHFKQINDSFGHPVGDEVLSLFTQVCRDTLRRSDWLARYGGEEFVMVLPDTDRHEAVRVLERIRSGYERTPGPAPMGDYPRSVSIGLADTITVSYDLDALLVAADRALYAAKKNGRNQVVVAHSTTDHAHG